MMEKTRKQVINLYRNATTKTYMTLSKQTVDVVLLPKLQSSLDNIGHISVKTGKENVEDQHQSIKSRIFYNQDYEIKTPKGRGTSLCSFSFPG